MKNKFFIILSFAFSTLSCHLNSKDLKIKESDPKKIAADPYLKNVPDSLKYLAAMLDTVLIKDQKYRSISDPGLYTSHLKEQTLLDAENLKRVTAVIDQYGWLSYKDVGIKGESTISIVMIHADPETKQKYYPGMFKALVNGGLSFQNYALFEDKLNAQKNSFQYYGTQLITYKGKQTLYPVYNVDSLDYFRKKMYLEPIEAYLKKNFHVDWDIEEYKKILPELIKDYGIKDSILFHTIDVKHELKN